MRERGERGLQEGIHAHVQTAHRNSPGVFTAGVTRRIRPSWKVVGSTFVSGYGKLCTNRPNPTTPLGVPDLNQAATYMPLDRERSIGWASSECARKNPVDLAGRTVALAFSRLRAKKGEKRQERG